MRLSLFPLIALLLSVTVCRAQASESPMIISAKDLLLKTGDPALVIFHVGTADEYPAEHIPGAVNIPFSSIVDDSMMFKDKSQLSQLFNAAGIQSGSRLVTYCHIGQQACLLYFAARLNGFPVQLYDGSYEDWSSRRELPVVNLKHK